MIPYTDIELKAEEYNQELGINRRSDKLLANDSYIYNSINTALSGDLKTLRLANSNEVKALATDVKGVTPASIMAISATDDDFLNAVDNRFITADRYATYVEQAQRITLWADLCFGTGFISKTFPSDKTILNAAEAYLNNFSPRWVHYYMLDTYTPGIGEPNINEVYSVVTIREITIRTINIKTPTNAFRVTGYSLEGADQIRFK